LKLIFSDNAWEDYLYWQKANRKILSRINTLIQEIKRNPFEGIGKPEPLKHALSGYLGPGSMTSIESSTR
jgi:toxin YoeB